MNDAGTEIAAKLKQGGAALPMQFKKLDHPIEARKRPQEPHPPFPYRAEEVTYENKAAPAKFAGTLTIPRGTGPYPVVLLLTGSGQQDRDEKLLGHRPFFVLADYLTPSLPPPPAERITFQTFIDVSLLSQLGQTNARAAPISSPKARVSVPSYTRVGSYPGW